MRRDYFRGDGQDERKQEGARNPWGCKQLGFQGGRSAAGAPHRRGQSGRASGAEAQGEGALYPLSPALQSPPRGQTKVKPTGKGVH